MGFRYTTQELRTRTPSKALAIAWFTMRLVKTRGVQVGGLARSVVVLGTEPDLRPKIREELHGDVLVLEPGHEVLVGLRGDDGAALRFAAPRGEVAVSAVPCTPSTRECWRRRAGGEAAWPPEGDAPAHDFS